jgi:tetratricopeptide (TPR) repeat protein
VKAAPKASDLPAAGAARRGGVGGLAAVGLLAAGVYLNTLRADFTLDDVKIVAGNPLIRDLGHIPQIFRTHYWASDPSSASRGLYRPLTILSFALNYAVHGNWAPGYHSTNVFLHAAASALLVAWLRRLFDARLAFWAGMLFAVHPIHTEAVAGVVGRAELLAFLGIAGSGYAYARAREAALGIGRTAAWATAAVLAMLGGALSKEIGVLAPLVLLFTEALLPLQRFVLRRSRVAIFTFAGFAIATGVFVALRAAATTPGEAHGFFRDVSAAERVWTALRVCGDYVALLVWPWRLQADYWLTDVPIASSPLEPGVLIGTACLLAMAVLVVTCRRRRPAVAWGLALFLLMLLPVSNLLFPIGVLKAERILYSPSAGFVTAASAGLLWLGDAVRARRSMPSAAAAVLVLAAALRTWVRNEDWRDNEALARATLKQSPNAPIFNVILGNALAARGERDAARAHYLRALAGAPRLVDVLYQMGNLERDEQHYADAIEYYERALAVQPGLVPVLNNLGRVHSVLRDWTAAVRCFEHVRAVDPNEPRAYLNLMHVYLESGAPHVAEPIATEALRRFSNQAPVFVYAARVYRALGRLPEADAAQRRARELGASP